MPRTYLPPVFGWQEEAGSVQCEVGPLDGQYLVRIESSHLGKRASSISVVAADELLSMMNSRGIEIEWAGSKHLATIAHDDIAGSSDLTPAQQYERFWMHFSFLLDKRTRERVFEPAIEDMKLQFAKALAVENQTRLERRWVGFCFKWRGARLIFDCSWRTMSNWALGGVTLIGGPGIKEKLEQIWFRFFS